MTKQYPCGNCGKNSVNGRGWICGECRSKGDTKTHRRFNELQDGKRNADELQDMAIQASGRGPDDAVYQRLVRRVGEKKARRLVQDMLDRGAGKKTKWWKR